jgi:hypothetical protein
MQPKITWQQGSSDPENATHFATISQWWAGLGGKEISWRQRLVPASGAVDDLDWDPQRFDEMFVLATPEVRGITLYWRKPDAKEERNTTVHKLELDQLQQLLYIYPQSQKEVVIRVGLPQVVYQEVKLNHPQVMLTTAQGNQRLLVLRDERQRLEIQVTLSPETLTQLKQQLNQS